MQSKIRIMIVDDHHMVRQGLIALLENYSEFEIVGEAKDGEAALTLAGATTPDVVLMDMMMPRMDGVETTRRLRERHPQTQVIALTSFDNDENVHAALKAGALGYLLKNVSVAELARAVRRAHIGESTLAPEAARALIAASTAAPSLGHDLTEREHDVLTLMIEGLNNREIAEQLFISSSTVKNHVSSILAKLDTTSRTKAVALAVRHQIVDSSQSG